MAHTIVIFGASGDLTSRKLIPALYRLCQKSRLPAETRIVGVARSSFSTEQWRGQLGESTAKFTGDDFDSASWNKFAQRLHYHSADATVAADLEGLAAQLDELDTTEAVRLYYLATSPTLYEPIIANLGSAGLSDQNHGVRRIVVEKPFGIDRKTAHALNDSTHRVFSEDQIYRIDHYLGKETVQNLLVLRFANSIFEPIWNRNYVDHVQITVAEEVTVGRRGDYYDEAGVLRDMFQN
ncbi:MAG: glucose-6-phosphate dehydrogenase, partial [Planctomycetales bacterium]|nr:glucose-6-phosphate dehydrogenase [Planctomycetales bacterium]